MEPKQAIAEWIQFAKDSGQIRVTGQRKFRDDLEKIEVMEAEGESLYGFARKLGLGFPERILKIAQDSPTRKGGAEHHVFFDLMSREGRVVKVTFPGKFGRWEHTPFLYLERCALLNEMVPVVNIAFEDCIKSENGDFSIVTSMQYFRGGHPTPQEADEFVRNLGFELLQDGTSTQDYISSASGLILRDCHALNWIKAEGGLIPIDIIPDRVVG